MLVICSPSCSPRCPIPNNYPFSPPTLSLSLPQSFPISTSTNNWAHSSHFLRFTACSASSKQQQRQQQQQEKSSPAKKRSPTNKKKRAPPPQKSPVSSSDDDDDVSDGEEDERSRSIPPSPLPKPPAGFVLDPHGRVLMASSKRIATIVDAANNLPQECVIRRVFESSRGQDCMLLCPVDMPVQILKSSNFNGWSAVNDEEVDAIIPSAAYALAKIHMHLVISGFCYTARGGFCYTEEDILEFQTDDGEAIDGLPTEGVEITCFSLDGAHYMIYTLSDPLLFVAVKDKNGCLQIADDELLEDPAIVGAIDEETEFNALVEEEAALLESLLGER